MIFFEGKRVDHKINIFKMPIVVRYKNANASIFQKLKPRRSRAIATCHDRAIFLQHLRERGEADAANANAMNAFGVLHNEILLYFMGMEKSLGISRFARVILLLEFLLVAYMLYTLTSSIYKSYQIDQYIARFDEENRKLASENESLSNDYLYFTSEAYQEKIAKQNFGLVNPGEEVIILPESEVATFSDAAEARVQYFRRWNAAKNSKKWFWFFFDKDRFYPWRMFCFR